ncbi:hypothetical protein [Croceicoccus sp. Ery15]|uniref:hypothetical protein n=1 Tax=Croceicoccus sp. Ery15 TaxID=1703338 RepID=UPI001E2A3893|nr:hypothetical protein [Croceicoccus sp. Ery15]
MGSIDYIFESESGINKDELSQGDLLHRTPELAAAIRQAHAHYADAPSYTHFLVLTQSCDLVRRPKKCKAPYITICAVRPLTIAVDRELTSLIDQLGGCPVPVGSSQSEVLAKQYLERVLNNTVDGLFFVPKGSANTVDEHMCAFLPLSIALKTDHYDVCLNAKVAQARPIFAAKIGSLASNLYGRVATPDLVEEVGSAAASTYKAEFFDELGLGNMLWLSPFERDELTKALARHDVDELGPLTREIVKEMVSAIPNPRDLIADRVVDILKKRKLLASLAPAEALDEHATLEEDAQLAALDIAASKVRNFIRNDAVISKVLKLHGGR